MNNCKESKLLKFRPPADDPGVILERCFGKCMKSLSVLKLDKIKQLITTKINHGKQI